ncbi:MAG: hypothetical protein HUJ94_08050 [Bacteroidales bacterium]|nr:hypothetical protein [Bacteroidales bacterium]
MRNTIVVATIGILISTSSCWHISEEWVNFDDWSSLDPTKCFVPFSTSVEELDDAFVEEAVTKTTSCNVAELSKEFISNTGTRHARSYCGTYMSIDENGDPIRLSGRIILPRNGKVSRIMLVSHFTIGSNTEAPSVSFPMEGLFSGWGVAVICPDYLGYGVSSDRIHPYLCSNLTARNVVDMYFAALPFLEHLGSKPEYDDIFLFGYSQGGATTLAVQRLLEQSYTDTRIRLNMAGGGPYDICATYDNLIETDDTDYPCAIPMIIQGMNVGEHLDLDYSQFFKPRMMDNLDLWVNSKTYCMDDVTELIGSNRVSDIMTELAMNKVSDNMDKLYLAMLDNSVVTYFYPEAPMYIFHSMDDNVVPYENMVSLRNELDENANVIYNVGKYGPHRLGFVRFLTTCIGLLESRGDIK